MPVDRDTFMFNVYLALLVLAIISFPVAIFFAFATGYWQWLAITIPSGYYIHRLLERQEH